MCNFISLFFSFFLPFFVFDTLFAQTSESPTVLVSVAPHKFFVEKIAGSTVHVHLMVPTGASSHTYEPTPKQVITASKASLWFCLGESFEARALKALKAYHPAIKAIDLKEGVDMITADPLTGQCCCHANSQDLHIWLSPRQAKKQATTITHALIAFRPEHESLYLKNLLSFCQELETLDHEIAQLLEPLQSRLLLVSHPAYAYFCRDYNLSQFSIEFEGKDPTPKQLNKTFNFAREANIKKIFIQPQYSSKGARLFAKAIQAEIVMLDPYSEDYFNCMRQIALALIQ